MEEISVQVKGIHHIFNVRTPCYELYCGPRRDKEPRWVPAIVTKVNIRVFPKGGTWRLYIEQLRPSLAYRKMQIPVNLQYLHLHWRPLSHTQGSTWTYSIQENNIRQFLKPRFLCCPKPIINVRDPTYVFLQAQNTDLGTKC